MAKRRRTPRSTLANPRYKFKNGNAAHKMSVTFVIDEKCLQIAIMEMMFKDSYDADYYVFYKEDQKLPIDKLNQTDVSNYLSKNLSWYGYDYFEKHEDDLNTLLESNSPKAEILKKIMIKLFPNFVRGEAALKFMTEED